MATKKIGFESDRWGVGARRAAIRGYESHPPVEVRFPLPERIRESLVLHGYHAWGFKLLALECFQEALEKFQQARDRFPEDAVSALAVGHALYALGRTSEAVTAYAGAPASPATGRIVERIRNRPSREGAESSPGLQGLLDLTIPEIRARSVKEIEGSLAEGGPGAVDAAALDRALAERLGALLTCSGKPGGTEGFFRGDLFFWYIQEVGLACMHAREGIFSSYQESYRREIAEIVSVSDGVLAELRTTAIRGDVWAHEPAGITLSLGERVFAAELEWQGDRFDTQGLLGLMDRVVEVTADRRRFRYFDPWKEGFGFITFLYPGQNARLEESSGYILGVAPEGT